jgi:hypothetical protein
MLLNVLHYQVFFISKEYPSSQILEAFGDIKDGRKAGI